MDSRVTSFGNIEVIAMVQNTAGSSKTGTLVAQVDIQGGDTYTKRQEVTVPGESSNSYTVTFDIPISTSLSSAQYEYSAQIE